MERASALNSKRMLFLGLFLASELLNMDLTETILQELRADAVVRALTEEVRQQLFSENASQQGIFEGSAFQHFHFRVIERPADKPRYCVRRATAPTLLDRAIMPLPVSLFYCYRLLR